MGLLQALFGSQMGQQGIQSGFTPVQALPQNQVQQAPQTLGIVQDILSQRFQPSMEDTGQAAFQTGINHSLFTPQQATMARLAPVMEIAKTLGTLNQSQLEIAKLNELMRHDKVTEASNPFSQPITTSPTTIGGNLSPSENVPQPNIPTLMRNNAPQGNAAPMSIPQKMATNGTQLQATGSNILPSGQSDTAAAIYGDNKGNDIPDTTVQAGPQEKMAYVQNDQVQQPQQPELQPLYRGNVPYTEGLDKGFQWAQDTNGKLVAMQIPGTVTKGANGEILTTDPQTGKTTQSLPQNPELKQKFEDNLGKITGLFDQLHALDASVEAGGNPISNKIHQLAGTKGIDIYDEKILPGGQQILEGTQAQTIRGQIQDLIKQSVPLYMGAMGITPTMERAVTAQQMLQSALGGDPSKSRQENQYSISNLSSMAGTGAYTAKYNSQPVAIITPDGRTGTVARGHLQDLIDAGGKFAE